ncbi:methyltransferase-associated protein [Aphelenchoides avenae]|nr:methyltransferase-associated protein [Aphelenchus avenae]
MKLLTHNFLSSQFLKGVSTGYPLILRATKVEKKDVEYNEAFTKRMIPKVDYSALRSAAVSIGEGTDLPEELGTQWESDESLLKKIHDLLVGVEVLDGELECPESGRRFMIREGIPNMLANEDEVE